MRIQHKRQWLGIPPVTAFLSVDWRIYFGDVTTKCQARKDRRSAEHVLDMVAHQPRLECAIFVLLRKYNIDIEPCFA